MEQHFIINGRFWVDPSANVLIDRETGLTGRLEARLVQVLCILAANAGRTVLREELVKQVWQNYGGGDEGLTQAISALRKALVDADKTLIRTVPKRGYLFAGTVITTPQSAFIFKSRKKPVVTAALLFAAALILLFMIPYLSNTFRKTTPVLPQTTYNPSSVIIDENREESRSNSVTCYDNHRNSYKWVSNGDAQPQFYINNIQLPIGQWESHTAIIAYLKRKLHEKSHDR